MKEIISDGIYDTRMWASDWRFSAAIVGLIHFFEFSNIDFIYGNSKGEDKDDYIEYSSKDMQGEQFRIQYLLFVENYFEEYMNHRTIEKILSNDEISEEQIKIVNDNMTAKSVCKKVFGKIKYSEENRDLILELIEKNRYELIQEIYRNGKDTYAKFANPNKLFCEGEKVSRLIGYYVDLPKKSKSMSYNWNYDTFVANDVPEFDFIPFAFTKTRDGYFVNNNTGIKNLYRTNNTLQMLLDEKYDNGIVPKPESIMFLALQNSAALLNYDVEVICKSKDAEYFNTLYLRRHAIEIFKKMADMFKKQNNTLSVTDIIEKPCRLEKEYLPVQKIVIDSVINNIYLDDLIEKILRDKEGANKSFLVSTLIKINQFIYGGENMEIKSYKAKQTAEELSKKIEGNKIRSYKQKLISAISFKDYDRFCEILLQFAAYAEMPFEFAYDLFDDFDANKNIAYAFVNGLSDGNYSNDDKNDKNNEKEGQ